MHLMRVNATYLPLFPAWEACAFEVMVGVGNCATVNAVGFQIIPPSSVATLTFHFLRPGTCTTTVPLLLP